MALKYFEFEQLIERIALDPNRIVRCDVIHQLARMFLALNWAIQRNSNQLSSIFVRPNIQPNQHYLDGILVRSVAYNDRRDQRFHVNIQVDTGHRFVALQVLDSMQLNKITN